MTSIGVTTATASVMPAARPAKMEMFVSGHVYIIRLLNVPKNVACPLTAPVVLFARSCLYMSYDVKRMAIFGTMPVRTAPRPL